MKVSSELQRCEDLEFESAYFVIDRGEYPDLGTLNLKSGRFIEVNDLKSIVQAKDALTSEIIFTSPLDIDDRLETIWKLKEFAWLLITSPQDLGICLSGQGGLVILGYHLVGDKVVLKFGPIKGCKPADFSLATRELLIELVKIWSKINATSYLDTLRAPLKDPGFSELPQRPTERFKTGVSSNMKQKVRKLIRPVAKYLPDGLFRIGMKFWQRI